jgi:hypothetical protein
MESQAVEMLKLLMLALDRGHGEVWQVRCTEEYQRVEQWMLDNIEDD